jgi:hypothetical protein
MRLWLFVVGSTACHLLCGATAVRNLMKLYLLMKDFDFIYS